MSVCLEPRSSGKAEQQQNKDAQLLQGGGGGRGGSCLSAPSFRTEAFPAHTDRMSLHNNASSGLFAGKESEKTERKGMGTESPLQAGRGALSQRGDTPAPSSPVSGSGIVKQAAVGRPGLKAE